MPLSKVRSASPRVIPRYAIPRCAIILRLSVCLAVFALNSHVQDTRPFRRYGNQSMAINDGKFDDPTGKSVNVGWMEALWRGWPYIFVVALRKGVKCGSELLLDYDNTAYWQSKQQMDAEHQGTLHSLRSDLIHHARHAIDQALS